MTRQSAGAVIALALPGLVRLGLVLVQWQGAGKPAGTRPVAAAIRDARVRSTAAFGLLACDARWATWSEADNEPAAAGPLRRARDRTSRHDVDPHQAPKQRRPL